MYESSVIAPLASQGGIHFLKGPFPECPPIDQGIKLISSGGQCGRISNIY